MSDDAVGFKVSVNGKQASFAGQKSAGKGRLWVKIGGNTSIGLAVPADN